MDKSFQERMHFFTAANNISENVSEFNENIAIRFLGYDNIIQFTLLSKIVVFLVIFGSNAQGNMKWFVLITLITYYL